MRKTFVIALLIAAAQLRLAFAQQTETYSRTATLSVAPSLTDTNRPFAEYLATEARIPSSHLIRDRAAVRMGMTRADIDSAGYRVTTSSIAESSNVIINVIGPSPTVAADYANALAAEFVDWQRQLRIDYLQSLSSNLVPLISRYERDLEEAEAKRVALERDHGTDDPMTIYARRDARRIAGLLELATNRLARETARIEGASLGAVVAERAQP